MGKWEIWPLANPKPISITLNTFIHSFLNRSSPKVAHVIRSRISTQMQNVVMIPRGVPFMCTKFYVRNCASKMFTRLLFSGFFQRPTARPLNRFSHKIHQTTWFRASMWLFQGLKNKNFTFNPLIPEKPPFLAWWPWPFDPESGVWVTRDVSYLCANFSLPRPLCSRLRPDERDRRQTKASLNAQTY